MRIHTASFSVRSIALSLSRLFAIGLIACLSAAQSGFAQRNLTDIPVPDPAEELASFIVADGFEVNLFAADPMLAKPIQMNFDEQGRLWIASSEVYPQIKPGQDATDKILVLEDKDRDGVADSTTVFAENLLIPTGVVPGDGGCYVANSTDLLHFADTDGDGKADQSRRILSGFGTEDTHHLLHTLRWGDDGMLYMNQSIYIHSHVETPYGVRHLNGGGIWQFRPETMELDIVCRGFVNPWGHHFDAWFQSFATDGAYGHGINYVFPGSVFVTAPGAVRTLDGLNPGSPKHCGLEIVSGGHLPDSWQGNMITNDFRANRVCRFVVTENGSGYASRQEVELLKTRNVAFRPIDVKMGPDGAIYIADWYNPIIQHGEVDFRDPRRDHTHGRIWRITAKDRPLVELPDIVGATPEELVSFLEKKESWTRLHAKLQMKRRPADQVHVALQKWLDQLNPSNAEYERLHLEALKSYQSMGVVNLELLESLLSAHDHRARAAAIRVAIAWRSDFDGCFDWLKKLVHDPHPRVRLEAVRGLATFGTSDAASAAAFALDYPIDRFLDFAIWQTMRDLAPAWLAALGNGEPVFAQNSTHSIFALKSVDSPQIVAPLLDLIADGNLSEADQRQALLLVVTHGQPNDLSFVLQHALQRIDASPEDGVKLLDDIQTTCRQRGRKRPSGDLSSIVELLSHPNEQIQMVAARCAGTWSIPGGEDIMQSWMTGGESDTLAIEAVNSIAAYGNAKSKEILKQTVSDSGSPIVRQSAIAALADLDLPLACEFAVTQLVQTDDGSEVVPIVRRLLGQQKGAEELNRALANAELKPHVAKRLLRTTLDSTNANEGLLQTIRNAGGLSDVSWKMAPEFVASIMKSVSDSGDPARGEAIYRRQALQCLKCHAIAGSGGDVGPDLVSIGASAPIDYLIEALIEPNAKIKENFHSKTVITIDGKTFTGIPTSSTDGSLSLKLADGEVATIREDDIEEVVDGRSLMADGLVDELTETELVDLVRFLSELGKVGEYSVSNRVFVRNWESLVWTQEGNRRLNRTSYDTAATNDPALTWRSDYSRVSGQMPIGELNTFVIHRGLEPTAFLRFQFDVDQPGNVEFGFSSTEGVELWIDGKPTPIDEQISTRFERGSHTIVLAVAQDESREAIRVELLQPESDPAQVRLATN